MVSLGIAIFAVFVLIALGSYGFSIYRSVKIVKHPMPKTIDWHHEIKILTILTLLNGFAVYLTTLGIILWTKITLQPYEMVLTFFGGVISGIAGTVFISTFIIHYYGKVIPEQLNKWLFRSLIISVPVFFVFLFVFTDGFANYLDYPLVIGLSFSKGFVTSGANLTFYALFILAGAVLVYFLCDHIFYKQYGKHGLIESTFLVAFPAGIIGARIAYVIGNWSTEFANREFWHVFAIWEGGLTILGGAIAGIVVGVLWFRWRNKGYSIWLAVDIIVPTILIAQAIGRWGNFFNREVYGFTVDESGWRWLPTIIFNQIHYNNAGTLIGDGHQVVVPLFLIESITNMIGYCVLAGVFGKIFRKHTELGDLAFGYLIWYGLTRAIMEPLRDQKFNMGDKGYWSWFWSIIFIAAGALLIVLNHFIRYMYRKKTNKLVPNESWFKVDLIGGSISLVVSVVLIAFGSYLMATNVFAAQLALNKYNTGIILLASGLSLLLFAFIYVPHFVEGKKIYNRSNTKIQN